MDTNIETWHEDTWWPWYRGLKKLHGGNCGVKGKSLKAFQKLKPTIEECERIYANSLELARYDLARHGKGEWVSRWPHSSTFINQGYFDREVGSFAELHTRQEEKCGCGRPAKHMHTDPPTCDTCYVRHYKDVKSKTSMEKLKQFAIERGLWKQKDETVEDWQQRCKTSGIRAFNAFRRGAGHE